MNFTTPLSQPQKKRKIGDGEAHQCNQCSYTTNKKCDLERHCQIQHSKTIDTSQSDLSNIEVNLVTAQVEPSPHMNFTKIDKVFKCNQCIYTSKKTHNIKRHIQVKHLKDSNLQESHTFTSSNSEVSYDSPQLNSSSIDKIKCNDCNATFTLKENLNRHIKEVHTDYHLKCSSCPYKTKRLTDLETHVKNKHSSSSEIRGNHLLHITFFFIHMLYIHVYVDIYIKHISTVV